MKRNTLFYLIAFVLIFITFLYFGYAYKRLIHYSEGLERNNKVHSGFQDLSQMRFSEHDHMISWTA